MRRLLVLILAAIMLIVCAGCFEHERGWDGDRGGYGDRDNRDYRDGDHGGHGDRDQGGYGDHEDRR